MVGIVCESDIIDQTKRFHLPTVINLMGYIVFLESGKKFEKELKKMIGLVTADIMTRTVKTVTPETSLEEIAALMTENRVHSIPVLKGKDLVGIIGKKDIVRSLAR
jgi:CBS domain-containing protein